MIDERSWEETAPERRWACPRRPTGIPGWRFDVGAGRIPSPFVGLVLSSVEPPARPSPPMNSLPRRLCPPIGLEGVVGVLNGECGECGGLVSAVAAAGLKEKSGSALADFILMPGVEPRRPVGYACSDIGRAWDAGVDEARVLSGSRMGKLNSGFGSSSM